MRSLGYRRAAVCVHRVGIFPSKRNMFSAFPCQALIEAHDQVAAKCYERPMSAANSEAPVTTSLMPADAIRMIGIQKKAGEPLVCWP